MDNKEPKGSNKNRVQFAEAAICAYLAEAHNQNRTFALQDLLGDLRHWADHNHADFEHANCVSEWHYCEELKEVNQQEGNDEHTRSGERA